jgi:hypothetical protein
VRPLCCLELSSIRADFFCQIPNALLLKVIKLSWFDKIAMECPCDSRPLFEGFSFLPRSGLHIPKIEMPDYVFWWAFTGSEFNVQGYLSRE